MRLSAKVYNKILGKNGGVKIEKALACSDERHEDALGSCGLYAAAPKGGRLASRNRGGTWGGGGRGEWRRSIKERRRKSKEVGGPV